MNLSMLRDGPIITRISLAVVLAGGALSLFVVQRPRGDRSEISAPSSPEELRTLLPKLDHEIDTLMTSFGIEKTWIRKRTETGSDSSMMKIERRIVIPLDIVPVCVNAAITRIARRYSATTAATENARENTVTIRIAILGTIYQTIVLKVVTDLKRPPSPPATGRTAT